MAVFPKVDSPLRARGLMAPPGLTPLGAKGSVRDRLRLPDWFSGLRPRELYSTALCVSRMGYASQPKLASSLHNKRPSFYSADRLGRYGALRRHFVCRLSAAAPLWWLTPPPSPRKRWDNKAPRTLVFISGSRNSTGCCAPAQRGKGGAEGTKGGKAAEGR